MECGEIGVGNGDLWAEICAEEVGIREGGSASSKCCRRG